MGKRTKYFRGFEVVSKKEEGKYYLDKPGEFESEDVHVILYQKCRGRKRIIIYLLDLELITTSSSKNFLEAVPDNQFRTTLEKASGIKAEDIYITKDAKELIESYEYSTNPNRI